MENKKFLSASLIKSLSTAVVAALIVASPGPFATNAFANVIGKAATNVNVGASMGKVALPTLTSPSLIGGNATLAAPTLGSSILPTLTVPTLNTTTPAASQAAVSRKAPSVAPQAAIVAEKAVSISPAAVSQTVAAPTSVRSAVETVAQKGKPTTLRQTLTEGVAEIKQAKSPSATRIALSNLFTGSRKTASQDSVLGSASRASRSLLKPAQALNAADASKNKQSSDIPAPGVANEDFLDKQATRQVAKLLAEYKRIDGESLWADAKETKIFVKELTWFAARARDKDGSPELAIESLENALATEGISNAAAVRKQLIALNSLTELGLSEQKASGKTYLAAEGVDNDGFTPMQRKGLFGMLWSRPFGMLGFSLSAMAYPLMLIDTVGKSTMYELFSLGGIISIGVNLLVGKVGDHLPLKKYIVFNALLRSALSAANAVLYSMGFLNFWSLLFLTVINAWQFASLFITDDAMMAEIVGPNRKKIFSTSILIRTMGLFVTIGSGIFLGDFIVDSLGFVATFSIVTVAAAIPALILWGALPNIGVKDGNAPLGTVLGKLPGMIAAAPKKAWEALKGVPWAKIGAKIANYGLGLALLGTIPGIIYGAPLLTGFLAAAGITGTAYIAALSASALAVGGLVTAGLFALKKLKAAASEKTEEGPKDEEGDGVRTILFNTGLLTAATAGYFFVFQTPFWYVGAVSYILTRSSIFKNVIMKNGLLKMALLMVIATTFVEVPLRNAVLGALSEELIGEAGKAAFYGKLIAAFTLGQLVTATGNLSKSLEIVVKKIGFFKLKKPLSFNLYNTTRWLGAAVLAAWGLYFIVPAGWLAMAVAAIPNLTAGLGFEAAFKLSLITPLLGMFAGAMTALWGYAREDKGKVFGTTLKTLGTIGFIGSLLLPIAPGLIATMPAWATTGLGLAIAGGAFYKFYQKVHDNAKSIKPTTWLRLEAVGLVAIGVLPLITGFNPIALYASLFLFGMTHTPAKYNIGSAYSATAKEVDDKNYQFLSAIKGTFVVMAGSIAYAIYGLAKDIPEMLWNNPNAFPFTWQVLAVIYAAIAGLYIYSSYRMDFDKSKKGGKEKKK